MRILNEKLWKEWGKKSNRLDTTATYTGGWPEIVVLCNLTRAPLSVQKHRVQEWLQSYACLVTVWKMMIKDVFTASPEPLDLGESYEFIDVPVDLVAGKKDKVIRPSMVRKHYKVMRDAGVDVSFNEFEYAHLDFTFSHREELLTYVMSRLLLVEVTPSEQRQSSQKGMKLKKKKKKKEVSASSCYSPAQPPAQPLISPFLATGKLLHRLNHNTASIAALTTFRSRRSKPPVTLSIYTLFSLYSSQSSMALAISFIALILLSSAIAFQRMSISGNSRDSSYMRELCLPSCSVKVFRVSVIVGE
ncbi:hypothetical protein DY000_02042790 [Brassica cretica]|uniref:Alpha/beta hydrolase fold-3 domain-containing protein n=1 Tax=Brassica cretica TaxID=69181 RepID=A0ABQ7BBY2_BRACR|nr:hypothetical protein DY000_02042790 [Brassica cretica]